MEKIPDMNNDGVEGDNEKTKKPGTMRRLVQLGAVVATSIGGAYMIGEKQGEETGTRDTLDRTSIAKESYDEQIKSELKALEHRFKDLESECAPLSELAKKYRSGNETKVNRVREIKGYEGANIQQISEWIDRTCKSIKDLMETEIATQDSASPNRVAYFQKQIAELIQSTPENSVGVRKRIDMIAPLATQMKERIEHIKKSNGYKVMQELESLE